MLAHVGVNVYEHCVIKFLEVKPSEENHRKGLKLLNSKL